MLSNGYVVFVDVETTGVTTSDRVVSLGIIGMDTNEIVDHTYPLSLAHLIFNPGIPCHPHASRVHGWSDEVLSYQPTFQESIDGVMEILGKADLIVAHNADFDRGFLSRELDRANKPRLTAPFACTMRGWREIYGSTGRMDHILSRMGIARARSQHGAFEDAWYAMLVWLYMRGVTLPDVPLPDVPPSNFRSCRDR